MKTVWILPGGGAHVAYTAGALLAAHDMGLPNPDIAIAPSGSSGTMAYYLAGQFSSIRRIWCELLATRKFGNPLRIWKLMDVDYLIDEVVKKQEPLNVGVVKNSHTNFFIPMMDAISGEIRYFSPNDGIDLFELLRVANSAPFFSGIFRSTKLKIDGKNYFDTRISSRPAQNINKAIQLGANRVIVFDNYHPKSSWTSGLFWYHIWLYTRNRSFRNHHLKLLMQTYTLSSDVKIIYIKPKTPFALAVWNNNKIKLRDVFNQGVQEATDYLARLEY